MKGKIALLLLLVLILASTTQIIQAQTNVDNVIHKLTLFGNAPFKDWKYSTDFSKKPEELSALGYDDSKWHKIALSQDIFIDSCWMRKEITLPTFLAGKPLPSNLTFEVSVDDYGYMFINGESKGKFPEHGEFTLPANSKPGEKVVILIKAINTGGPMKIYRAQLRSGTSEEINNIITDLTISLKVGQKLLSFDTHQSSNNVTVDPGIDKSKMDKNEKERLNALLQNIVTHIDLSALENGEADKFIKSVEKVKDELKPISEYAKRFTLQFAANAHIDAAWLWRKKETVEVCDHTFSSVMNMFKARDRFTYSQSAAAYYEWIEKNDPALFDKIKEKVKEGRWEIVGGQWVELDCNLPSGESWYRQFLYAQKYFEKNFGKKAVIGWNPDSFGYNANLPMFFNNAGIDAFVTQKIGWNDSNVFPYRLFWWQSPDSSRVLTYFPFNYISTVNDPYSFADQLRQYEANTGITKMMVLFGIGNHGGGPSIEMMGRIDKFEKLTIYPKIEFGTSEDYIKYLRTNDLTNLPVWKDELYLEYHRGTLTTQSDIKKWNRSSEVLLSNAEKFSAFSSLSGQKYKSDDLHHAWKNVLFNQFHDILPGSSIREVYVDANQDYKESETIGKHVLGSSIDYISAEVNTSSMKHCKPIVIFNPLSWERNDIAELALPYADEKDYSIIDETGKEIASQIITKSKYERSIIFEAKKVPSLGYKVYGLKDKKSQLAVENVKVDKQSIENEFFKASVDSTGWVKSIYDKKNGKEILTGYGNKLQLLEDKPKEYEAWNIGFTGKEYFSKFRKAEVVEQGPVRSILRLYRDYLNPGVVKAFPTEDFPSSFFTQDIILYKGTDRVDFTTSAEWWEEKTMLKTVFPVAAYDSSATYEIPYGKIKRATTANNSLDKAKWEVAGAKWADLSDDNMGVSILNKAKYGYDIKGNVMRLSLLRSPKYPDKMADMGNHSMDYALFIHKGKSLESTIQKGYEFNYPLITALTDNHKGSLPADYSFMSIEPKNIIITTVKKIEEPGSDAVMIQFYETEGKDTDVQLKLPKTVNKAFLSNFLEEEVQPIKAEGKTINLKIKGNSLKTLRVVFNKQR